MQIALALFFLGLIAWSTDVVQSEDSCSHHLISDDHIPNLWETRFEIPDPIKRSMNKVYRASRYPRTSDYDVALNELASRVKTWHSAKLKALQEYKPLKQRGLNSQMNFSELDQIFESVASNPVTSICSLKNYDLWNNLELCYGRAAAIYIEAGLKKVSKNAIKKVWVTGIFQASDEKDWKYHVATAIRSDRGWMVLDPLLFDGPVGLYEWHFEVMRRSKRLDDLVVPELYITAGSRVSPNKDERYHDTKDTKKVRTRTFFADLFSDLKARNRNSIQSRAIEDDRK